MWEIKIEVDAGQAEAIDEVLAENELVGWHVYTDVDAQRAWISGFFPSAAEAENNWEELREKLPEEAAAREPELQSIADDWKSAYRAHFHRWQFGHLHWVPIWEKRKFDLPEGDEVVWLDPGMAFGTGNHETTRLCVERVIEAQREWKAAKRDLEDLDVIDAGCGSGILAISAAKVGFKRISGFDNDPVAVEVSRENAQLNDLGAEINFFNADIVDGLRGRRVDLLVANILADVLCEYANELVGALRPGGRLVLSGILSVEIRTVESTFRKVLPDGEFSSREMNEWADLLVVRK